MYGAGHSPISSDEVRKRELKCIEKRRREAGLAVTGSAADNLVGLALSGGGLRSATFNLGLLQAFRRYGLLRYIDYLSSVSGGGYTAGYLARAAHDEENFHDKSPIEHDGAVDGSIRLTDHRSYRGCGSYLRRPVEFFAEYVLCTIPVLALFLSGLIAAALTIAILWRTFDFPTVRDRLSVVGWDVDLLAAFIPTVPIFFFWVTLEAVHRIDFIPDRYAARKRVIRLMAIVFSSILVLGIFRGWFPFRLVPIAAALAIPCSLIGVNWFSRHVTAKLPIAVCIQRSLSVYLAPGLMTSAVLCALLSLICGFGLVISYDKIREDYSIKEAAFVLFVLGFAILSMFVAWAVHGTVRTKRLIFLALVLSPAVGLIFLIANGDLSVGWLADLFGVSQNFSSQQMLREPLMVFVAICLLVLFRYKRLLQSARPDASFQERLIFGIVVSGIAVGVPLILIGWVGRENVSGYASFRNADLTHSDIKDPRAFLDLWNDSAINTDHVSSQTLADQVCATRKASAILFGSEGWDQNKFDVLDEQHGWLARAGMLIESSLPRVEIHTASANPASEYLTELRNQREAQRTITSALSNWLNSPELTESLVADACFRSSSNLDDADDARAKCRGYLETATANMHEGKVLLGYFDRATDHLRYSPKGDSKQPVRLQFVDARGQQKASVEPFNVKVEGNYWDAKEDPHFASNRASFNRLLLEALYPDIIKRRAMVSTPVVIEQDQLTRVRWLAFAGSLFLVLFLFLPVNAVSPFHSFYKRMIEREFLSPIDAPDGCDSLVLSSLRSHKHGGPYPLLMGTLHFTDDHDINDLNSKERLRTGRSVPLVMSPKYCGSREFGYLPTSKSPWKALSFADAVAISGAALSPIALGTGALYWILTAFNLRTGLWIVEPKTGTQSEPRRSKSPVAKLPSSIGRVLRYVKPIDIYRKFVQPPKSEPHRTSDAHSPGQTNGSSQDDESRNRADRVWGLGSAADGGYSDFLGLEPLLERRCRLIIVSDAGCNEGEEEFRSLGDVIRKVALDLSVEILDWDDDRPLDIERLRRDEKTRYSPQHFIMGRVRYPAKDGQKPDEGVLVYIQMAMSGDEGSDISQYHRAHDDFPNSFNGKSVFRPRASRSVSGARLSHGRSDLCRTFGRHSETVCDEACEKRCLNYSSA